MRVMRRSRSVTSPVGTAVNPWENEHLLQNKRIIDFVAAKTGSSKRAIVLGDFNASTEYKDASGTVLSKPEGESGYKLLVAAFPETVPAGYTPACTFCGENPLIPAADKTAYTPEWIDHIFLSGIPAANTVSLVRTFMASTVAAKDPKGADVMVPLSDHYGLRAVITLP